MLGYGCHITTRLNHLRYKKFKTKCCSIFLNLRVNVLYGCVFLEVIVNFNLRFFNTCADPPADEVKHMSNHVQNLDKHYLLIGKIWAPFICNLVVDHCCVVWQVEQNCPSNKLECKNN